MSEIAIRVHNLGKRYRIGLSSVPDTLRDRIAGIFGSIIQARASKAARTAADQQIWALKDLSFEVRRGEVIGIIGRNGAGKSTLLKILSRITEPTTGWAEVYGRVGSLLEVGTGFHPELTGRENVYLNGAILGMQRREIARKFDAIVAFAEVERFIDTPVKHYSSGMYMRLAFAVAAYLEPEILLVDEVLAVGDAAFQRKCLGKMGDVASAGKTVLLVSHNMAAVLGLCSQAIVIEKGNIAYQGAAAEAVKHYQHLTFQEVATGPEQYTTDNGQPFSLLRLRLMDTNGHQVTEIRSESPLTVELTLRTPGNGEAFAVGVAIFSSDGVYCYGTNTFLDNIRLTAEHAAMTVTLHFEALNLLDGMYALSIGITDETATYAHDYRPKAYHFAIVSQRHDHGLCYLPHTWSSTQASQAADRTDMDTAL